MVIAILLLAFILRLINLNQSLWLDEAVQAITSAGHFNGLWTELIGDFHPPLYHIFMWGWVHLFGSSEIILRLPSVLFGVGTVYFGYKIVVLVSDKPASPAGERGQQKAKSNQQWYALLLFATSPYLIYYSQEARMYSMAVFLATLSSYLLINLLRNREAITLSTSFALNKPFNCHSMQRHGIPALPAGRYTSYLPFLLVNVTLIYTDYYGWLVVLAQSLILLYRKSWKSLILNSVFLLLAYVPWMNMLITQMQAGVQATQTLPVWASLVNLSVLKAIPLTLIKFTIGRISFPDKQLYLLVVLVVFTIYSILVVLGVKEWLKNRRNPNARYINILIYYTFLWLVVPLIIAWAVSFKVPNFQPFRLLLILPAFHLLTAYLISNIKQFRVRWWLFIIVVAINLGGYLYFQLTPSMQREDWRGLVNYSDSIHAILLIPSESSNWPERYYTNGETKLVYGAIGAEQVKQPPVLGGVTVYYLRYLVPVFDPGEKLQKQLQALGYNKTEIINFNQLEIWKYDRSYQ